MYLSAPALEKLAQIPVIPFQYVVTFLQIHPLTQARQDRQIIQSINMSQNNTPQRTAPAPVNGCPYHGPILAGEVTSYQSGKGLDAMGRYMAEGPQDQYALYVRADTAKMSTSKSCTCSAATAGMSYGGSSTGSSRRGA